MIGVLIKWREFGHTCKERRCLVKMQTHKGGCHVTMEADIRGVHEPRTASHSLELGGGKERSHPRDFRESVALPTP